jgi:hypothetical protein
MKRKRIPVNIPLDYDGSFNDVLQSFINTMQTVTGKTVDIECSLKGELTVYFENDVKPKIEKRPYRDIDVLYRNEKINDPSAMQNNVLTDERKPESI